MSGRHSGGSSSSFSCSKSAALLSPSKTSSSTIECCICCDVFKDPRLLQCGHTFCLACITQLSDSTSTIDPLTRHRIVVCPECRSPTRAHEEYWIKNYRLTDVIQAVQTLTAQVEQVKLENVMQTSSPVPSEDDCRIVCADCNDSFPSKHMFFCVVCSHGLPFLKLACGTCGITKHPQHQLVAYDELALREEKDAFIGFGVSRLKDVQELLKTVICTCGRQTTTSFFYQNVVDALGAWEPLLGNLRLNERLTKYDISEYELNLNRFIDFVNETLKQVKQLEQEHSHKVNEIRVYFQEQMNEAVASIGTSPQERNHPLVSFPSTSGINQTDEPPITSFIVAPQTSMFVHPSAIGLPRPQSSGRRLRGHRCRGALVRTETPSSSTTSEDQ